MEAFILKVILQKCNIKVNSLLFRSASEELVSLDPATSSSSDGAECEYAGFWVIACALPGIWFHAGAGTGI
jgi:hypothetical protein